MRKCLLVVAVLALGTMASAQSINMNWTNESRPKSCADLKISSDDMKVARAEQKFTIAPSQAGLELNGAKNGGVRVYGWDNPNYEVIACKAAWAETDGEAQQVLASLNVTQQGTAINTTGSNDDNRHWTVMYLVHVPHDARLKATAYNGPMSVDDVDGNVNVSSHNGPVHVKRCKGEITAETVNGPVAFT